MSRKNKQYRREFVPDYKYNSVLVTKFINKVMQDGKKSIAQKIVYGALENLSSAVKEPVSVAFEKALKNVIPVMEVRSRRVGGSTYQVPVEVRFDRGMSLAMRWIVGNARSRSGKPFVQFLSEELIDSYNNTGSSVKKREEAHKMAESNKAFAHFRW